MTIIHYTLAVPTKIKPEEETGLVVHRGVFGLMKRLITRAKAPKYRWAWYEKSFESDHEIRSGDDVYVEGVKLHVRDRAFHVGTKDCPEGVMKLSCWAHYMGMGLDLRFQADEADEHVQELEEAGFIYIGASE